MSVSDNESQDIPEASLKNTTIPLLLCDNVKSDKGIYYALRLTPDDSEDYGAGDVAELLDEICQGDYIYCQELSAKKKIHFHAVFFSSHPFEDIKKWIKDFLVVFYPLNEKGKWLKEEGNKRYNFKPVRDLEKAVKYLLKDKVYKCGSNINLETVEDLAKKSYKKYSKEAFAVEYDAIKKQFHEGEIDHKQLRSAIIKLKGQYGQPINLQRINDIVLGLRVRKDPELADEL